MHSIIFHCITVSVLVWYSGSIHVWSVLHTMHALIDLRKLGSSGRHWGLLPPPVLDQWGPPDLPLYTNCAINGHWSCPHLTFTVPPFLSSFYPVAPLGPVSPVSPGNPLLPFSHLSFFILWYPISPFSPLGPGSPFLQLVQLTLKS